MHTYMGTTPVQRVSYFSAFIILVAEYSVHSVVVREQDVGIHTCVCMHECMCTVELKCMFVCTSLCYMSATQKEHLPFWL